MAVVRVLKNNPSSVVTLVKDDDIGSEIAVP
jgi:hypothetical protein